MSSSNVMRVADDLAILIDRNHPFQNTEDFLATLDANLRAEMAKW